MFLSLSTFWNFYLASNMEVMMGLTRQGGFPLVDVRGQANLLSFPTTPPHLGPLFSFLFVFFYFLQSAQFQFPLQHSTFIELLPQQCNEFASCEVDEDKADDDNEDNISPDWQCFAGWIVLLGRLWGKMAGRLLLISSREPRPLHHQLFFPTIDLPQMDFSHH